MLDEVRVTGERKVRARIVRIAVPAAVRVEAGWDRTAPAWAFINRFPIADIPPDTSHADAAAGIARRTGATVADAHLGAAIQAADADQVTVLTSDPVTCGRWPRAGRSTSSSCSRSTIKA